MISGRPPDIHCGWLISLLQQANRFENAFQVVEIINGFGVINPGLTPHLSPSIAFVTERSVADALDQDCLMILAIDGFRLIHCCSPYSQ
jgi:hypothetical protein